MDGQRNVIVVLEDDPRVRGALCLLLSDWDFRTADGASAVEALAQVGAALAAVTAVITDYDLGAGVNGIDEARALRAAGVAAPVLVISGSMRGRAGELAREAGFHFLSKPVKPVDIQNWLATRTG
jgi:two-component system, sensor histidine kinase